MCPIITTEDELDLSRLEKEFVKTLNDLSKQQGKIVKTQQKFAENILDMNITRDSMNRTMRDVYKQIKMLAREHKSNVKDEDVKLLESLIQFNNTHMETNKKYLEALKDLTIEKEYLINIRREFADALNDVAGKRKAVIKKAIDIDKVKNKMIEPEKVDELDQEQNDLQREFDRARDILLKKNEHLLEVKSRVSKLWIKLKDATSDLG